MLQPTTKVKISASAILLFFWVVFGLVGIPGMMDGLGEWQEWITTARQVIPWEMAILLSVGSFVAGIAPWLPWKRAWNVPRTAVRKADKAFESAVHDVVLGIGALLRARKRRANPFPNITLNKNDMWPYSHKAEAQSQYVVIRKLRIANNEERQIALIVRLWVNGTGRGHVTTDPEAQRPAFGVSGDYLPEVIRIGPRDFAQGGVAYFYGQMDHDLLEIGKVYGDGPAWREAELEIEDVHSGERKRFPLHLGGIDFGPGKVI